MSISATMYHAAGGPISVTNVVNNVLDFLRFFIRTLKNFKVDFTQS